ncbi:MAG TPA: hypothetical protein VHJ37_01510 [Thermoleophilaceae bacterium]|nr:hypothetical protein [Thermoleophilaceae bacterium]
MTPSVPSSRPAIAGRWLLPIAAVLLSSLALGVPTADAAARSCKPVVNPYPNTRYDGVDLSRIRATGVSCRVARRVARRAHHKALGLTPPPSGIKRFNWRGWRVTGNLRASSDRYVAARGAKRVRWRF